MYPALDEGLPLPERNSGPDPLFPEAPGAGRHEVVAYTADHQGSLGRLSVAHLELLLRVIRDRCRALAAEQAEVVHVLPFCNHGPLAGATLAHPHLQILASSVLPALIRRKQECLAEHAHRQGECLLCRLAGEEESRGERFIAGNEAWVALAPWASRFPYEIQLLPRRHGPSLEEAEDRELALLAPLMQRVLARLEGIHQNLSYNVVFQSGPAAGCWDGAEFHWHVEILPRLARQAGFEAGSGFAINSVTPEHAAQRLRGKE